MIPGIDPKIDIAFKKVFGSENSRNLTMALIDAVLEPAPWQRLTELELLNPYTPGMTLDDRLCILDVKARDGTGRLFNVEMQMVAWSTLPKRFLYYWSQLHASQLTRGDDFSQLCSTISICFINGRIFPDQTSCHHHFRLLEVNSQRLLTDDLDMHLLELSNFERELAELKSPLDLWLYFLKNGEELDADALPAALDTPELRQAMEVLKMFSLDEMEREIYEGRLKAEWDARTQQRLLDDAIALQRETQRQRDEALRRVQEAEQQALVQRIQLCQRVLGRDVTDATELRNRDESVLHKLAAQLEREVLREPR